MFFLVVMLRLPGEFSVLSIAKFCVCCSETLFFCALCNVRPFGCCLVLLTSSELRLSAEIMSAAMFVESKTVKMKMKLRSDKSMKLHKVSSEVPSVGRHSHSDWHIIQFSQCLADLQCWKARAVVSIEATRRCDEDRRFERWPRNCQLHVFIEQHVQAGCVSH